MISCEIYGALYVYMIVARPAKQHDKKIINFVNPEYIVHIFIPARDAFY